MSALSMSLIERSGWTLLNSVWQLALVCGLTALLQIGLRNRPARLRYSVLMLALLSCCLIPLLTAISGFAMPTVIELDTAVRLAQSGSDRSLQAEPFWLHGLRSCLPVLVAFWLAGIILMLLRFSAGLLWMRRMVSSAILAGAELQQRMQNMAQQMQIRRPVRLLSNRHASAVITIGILRPVILLPVSLLGGVDIRSLEALIAHELAHISRWDYLCLLIQNLIQAMLFYHPGIWWLCRKLDIERELIADENAKAVLGDGRQLAVALQQLDQWQFHRQQMALAAQGGDLLARIRQLLSPQYRAFRLHMLTPVLLSAVLALTGLGFWNQATAQFPPDAQTAVKPAAQDRLPASFYVDTHSAHALVVDEQSGKVLFARDADTPAQIASISKLLTAMVIIDSRQPGNRQITLDLDDIVSQKLGQFRLMPEQRFSIDELMSMMLIPSSNTAAYALANHFPGGRSAFLEAARAKLKALGLAGISFVDPAGLSDQNTATASELVVLLRAAAAYPLLQKLTTTPEMLLTMQGKTEHLRHTNSLLSDSQWKISLSKTGMSRKAGRCLTMRMDWHGRPLLVVLLNAQNISERSEDLRNISRLIREQPEIS